MNTEQESKYDLLTNHANAVRALMSSVESTIGPKGLDTMLVGQSGSVVITNDGVTILNLMEVSHPVARMIIHAVNTQQSEVGDGTTTTALLAGEMVLQGLEKISKGVPVAQIITGLQQAIQESCRQLELEAVQIADLQDETLYRIAYVAGRENEAIAKLVLEGAQMIGLSQLLEPQFKLADRVRAVEGGSSEVFDGVLLGKGRLNIQMPQELHGDISMLILDDPLEPEEVDKHALTTEGGFQRHLALQEEFQAQVENLIQSGVQAVFVDRGVDGLAEELLTEAGILVVARVPHRQLLDLAEHTGAKLLRRTALKKESTVLRKQFGWAAHIIENEKLEQIKVSGGQGKPMATIMVSAATGELTGERERIARDAAASLQSALAKGVVAGGGAAELSVARQLEQYRERASGMAAFGVDCVIAALKKPFMHIVANAGYNPLEKLAEVSQAQQKMGNNHLALDCDTGMVQDLFADGVVDPLYVKIHGLQTAGEVAEAILRINIIVKKREPSEGV